VNSQRKARNRTQPLVDGVNAQKGVVSRPAGAT
jgi:hypothetical protein